MNCLNCNRPTIGDYIFCQSCQNLPKQIICESCGLLIGNGKGNCACYDTFRYDDCFENELGEYDNWLDSMEARQLPQEQPEDFTLRPSCDTLLEHQRKELGVNDRRREIYHAMKQRRGR